MYGNVMFHSLCGYRTVLVVSIGHGTLGRVGYVSGVERRVWGKGTSDSYITATCTFTRERETVYARSP